MVPARSTHPAPVPLPSYHQTMATALHLDALTLTLVTCLQLLEVCRVAVQLAYQQCPPPLPAGPGGAPRVYAEASLLLVSLLRTLWRLSYQEAHDWLCAWPALALDVALRMAERLSLTLRQRWAPINDALIRLGARALDWLKGATGTYLVADALSIMPASVREGPPLSPRTVAVTAASAAIVITTAITSQESAVLVATMPSSPLKSVG